jgi:hypothetical protein
LVVVIIIRVGVHHGLTAELGVVLVMKEGDRGRSATVGRSSWHRKQPGVAPARAATFGGGFTCVGKQRMGEQGNVMEK